MRWGAAFGTQSNAARRCQKGAAAPRFTAGLLYTPAHKGTSQRAVRRALRSPHQTRTALALCAVVLGPLESRRSRSFLRSSLKARPQLKCSSRGTSPQVSSVAAA